MGTADQKYDMDKIHMTWSARLLDSTFKEIKELDSLKDEMSRSVFHFPEPLLCWSASSDQAFVANEATATRSVFSGRMGRSSE